MGNLRAVLSGLYSRDEGNIRAFIFSLIAFAITSDSDIFLFKIHLGDTWANILYFIISIIAYYIFIVIYELLFIHPRIKIVPMQNSYQDFLQAPLVGNNFYTGLDVVIPPSWEIVDCYVILEKVIPVYYDDRVLIKSNFADWFSMVTKPEYKMLRWKSPLASQNGSKINIGENSNRESVLVGKIVVGTAKDARNKKVDIRTFEFCLCSAKPNEIHFHKFGLYRIFLTFYWYRNGIKRRKYFNGYIYSESKDGIHKIMIRQGNYHKDKDVPKPLPEVEKVHQQPKATIKKTSKAKKQKTKKSRSTRVEKKS